MGLMPDTLRSLVENNVYFEDQTECDITDGYLPS